MIKKFNQFIHESHDDIDPYGEENWNNICLDDYWAILKGMSLVDLRMDMDKMSNREFIYFVISFDYGNYEFYLTDFNNGLIQILCEEPFGVDQMKEGTKEELLNKISKLSGQKINESHELDPYGEEDWDPILDRYFNLLQSIESIKHVMFIDSGTLTYFVDYPNKGSLQFHILELKGEEVLLVWDEGRRHITLQECTEKELWDKMTYLVEGI